MPIGISELLTIQIRIRNLTAETVIQQSHDLALQALMVDPVNIVVKPLPELLDHMIAGQHPWLDCLK